MSRCNDADKLKLFLVEVLLPCVGFGIHGVSIVELFNVKSVRNAVKVPNNGLTVCVNNAIWGWLSLYHGSLVYITLTIGVIVSLERFNWEVISGQR